MFIHKMPKIFQIEKRPKLFEEADVLIKAIPAEVLEENRRKLKSGFKLFRLANEGKLKKDITRIEDLERKVSRMWNQVRQYYLSNLTIRNFKNLKS